MPGNLRKIKEGILWSFSVRINELGEIVLVKRHVRIEDLKALNSEDGSLPIAELTSILDYLNEIGIEIEKTLVASLT